MCSRHLRTACLTGGRSSPSSGSGTLTLDMSGATFPRVAAVGNDSVVVGGYSASTRSLVLRPRTPPPNEGSGRESLAFLRAFCSVVTDLFVKRHAGRREHPSAFAALVSARTGLRWSPVRGCETPRSARSPPGSRTPAAPPRPRCKNRLCGTSASGTGTALGCSSNGRMRSRPTSRASASRANG